MRYQSISGLVLAAAIVCYGIEMGTSAFAFFFLGIGLELWFWGRFVMGAGEGERPPQKPD